MQEPQKLFNRNFLLQWQGQSVSRLGSQVFSAAMIFWIKHATGSASVIGLLSLISGLPAVLLTPLGGAFADRYSRRKIIIVGDLIRGASLGLLALLMFWRPDAIAAILVGLFIVSVINGVVNSFFGPALAATIPDLVPRQDVVAANSMGQLSLQTALFIGQGLGGVLYRILGAPILFLFNGLSFLYSAGSEVFVQIPQTIPERKGTLRAQLRIFAQDIAEGFRFVWQQPGLRELVLLSAVLSFFGAPIVMLMPFYVEDTLGVRPDWYGFILAAFGAGTMLGYLLAGVIRLSGSARAKVLIAFMFLTPIGYILLGLAQRPLQALAMAALGGIVGGFVTVNITTLVQLTTPSAIRGRVVGLLAALSTALTPIAMGLSGIIADLLNQNIRLIYIVSGAVIVLSALGLTLIPAFRRILAFDIPDARRPGPQPTAVSQQQTTPQRLNTTLEENERTRDVYEHIADYQKPPVVPIPRPDEMDQVLTELDQPRGSLARAITDVAFAVVGMNSFLKRLPVEYETLARRYNLRLPGLYGPVISATLALRDDPGKLDPLQRAAALILAVREFQRAVFSGRLPPDTYRGEALEMGQYPGFFSTSQVILPDRVQVYKSKVFSRVNVIVDGHFFILDIGEPEEPLSAGDLTRALSELVIQARRAPQAASPGPLTCTSHPTQMRQFNRLRQVGNNAQSLEALKHSLFTLALDLDDAPVTLADAARLAHSQNPENRWFHASLQLVVFGNAQACAICNFSTYLDGNVMMRGGAEIQRRAAAMRLDDGSGMSLTYTPLTWEIPPLMSQRAQPDRRRVLDDQPATFELPGFGHDLFVAHGVEAVPAFVAALQMTVNKLVGKPAHIVQFVTMSRYRCADLNTVGVSSAKMQAFSHYMSGGKVEIGQAHALLLEAIASQVLATRRGRQYLSLPIIANLLVRSKSGAPRLIAEVILTARRIALAKLGVMREAQRDVLISHPEIYPEVPIVGRPGVRLPYVTYFGLHYQMLPDKTVVTLMPAVGWQTSNQQIIETLRASLDQVRDVLERATA